MGPDEVISAQIGLYGEPLGARFGRLLSAFGISQARLAAVIGLSAPMISQLAHGQRVKISNPAVYARLLRLEELARGSHDPQRLRAELDAVAASQPALTTESITAPGLDDRAIALRYLGRIADRPQLTTAADATAGALADLLREAANADQQP